MQNSFKEVKPLLLWSWQGLDFSLTEGTVDDRLSESEKIVPGLPKSRKELSERLGTDQFIWCCIRQDEARGRPGSSGVKWQLEVPKHHVLAFICNVAWHWILNRNAKDNTQCIPPLKFKHVCSKIAPNKWREFKKGFHDGWKNKTTEKLWDALFLDKVVEECTHVLLRHPVEKGWIKNCFR